MLNDLRNDDSSPLFNFEDDFEEEEPVFTDEDPVPEVPARGFQYNPYWLGLAPAQRFILAVMFFIMTCILSSMFLIVTGRIFLPF